MIVKNEAHNLPALFESVKDCVDEIHITDTGSTDGTIELATRLGAHVHHFNWINDFAAARNESFKHIKTDYGFWLDGDDVLHNPEGFKTFRDTAMCLADYWIAPYYYSSDAQGNPVCTFARERVFRMAKNPTWKYFVHEGIIPMENARVQYTPSWAVKHIRTNDDLLNDRSRNLNLFSFNMEKGPLDSRMQYYYGKELYEAGKHKEAAEELGKAITKPDLEAHDRILGFQYICYALMSEGQFEKAINLAHQGLCLDPTRAEFYVIIGDCYLKMGKLNESIPSFNAAKNCKVQAQVTGPSVIFHNEPCYSSHPTNQLARVYANMGDLDRAEKESDEAILDPKNQEAQLIHSEIKRVKLVQNSYKNAKPCDDIVITCPPYAPYLWDADIAKEKAMGGSETACIEMARHLHKLSGRPVKVFNVRDTTVICDGVEYISTQKAAEYMGEFKPYVHIAWRHNFKLTDAPTFLWCHDLITQGAENTAFYDKLLCLTPFHKNYCMTMQGVPEDKILVTRNGIKPERFTDGPWVKNPNKIVFPSSPDRGLDRAMLVLDEVRKTHPDVELHVFYGIEHLHKYGLQSLADKLKSMMEARPWVKYHGATQQDVLMGHLKEASIWLHPCDFIETSCITAMEMVCAGVYPVTRKLGGLADTLAVAESKGMATLIDSDCVTELEFKSYIDATVMALNHKAWENVHFDPNSISWESVAKEWIETIFPQKESLSASG